MKHTSRFTFGCLIIGLGWLLLWLPPAARAESECEPPEYPDELNDSYDATELEDLFQEAHLDYHDYVNCLFQTATETILGSFEDEPTFEAVCTPQEKLKELMVGTSTVTIMNEALKAYNAYTDYLNKLTAISQERVRPDPGNPISNFVNRHRAFQHLVDKELQYAIVAVDRALMALKEMRQAYLLHLHFQCVQAHLEKYLTLLDKMRGIITGFPPRFEDASIH